jgi:AraC family transcriptional regulator, transcriptional activator for feuABC-ybbA operon
MKTIHLNLSDKKSIFETLQTEFGGDISKRYREIEFTLNNKIGSGIIRGIELESGITFLEFDLACNEDVKITLQNKTEQFVTFAYCGDGSISHNFGNNKKNHKIEAYQTSIISNIKSNTNELTFKKDENVKCTLINVNTLFNSKTNTKLNTLFIKDKTSDFFYCGSHNLKIAETIKQIDSVKNKGIVRTLLINGLVNVVLALEIAQHNKDIKNTDLRAASLTKNEMEQVKEISDYIQNYYDTNLQISELEKKAGLTAAKLQEGFKLLHGLTICDYVKSVRLKKSEELISTTDLTVSEIVYSLGFSSRSYFSKIFKEKYNCTPSTYKKKNRLVAISA